MNRIYQADAFSTIPFRGNPAAVCLLDTPRSDEWMQALAAEMNLSETAFPSREGTGWRLRWFTPLKEVSLCGHATLATAHILWSEGFVPASEPITFETLSGTLTAARAGEWIQLDFPVRRVEPSEPSPVLARALGDPQVLTWNNTHTAKLYCLLELASAEAVRTLTPDFSLLAACGIRGIIVTARSDIPAYDFISRFFAPLLGVNEDPVTGSAHCYLAPYWKAKLGKAHLVGYQASARGGVVACERRGERVLLRGQAVTVFRGELAV
ncbi:MAG: PhzF family phenazine biosynthesis protein [Anaerolineae bacterium]